jgi:hypothetical protein
MLNKLAADPDALREAFAQEFSKNEVDKLGL